MPFCFILETQAGVGLSYEGIPILATEILHGCRNRDSSNRAGLPSHMNTPIFFTKEIGVMQDLSNLASLVNWAQ